MNRLHGRPRGDLAVDDRRSQPTELTLGVVLPDGRRVDVAARCGPMATVADLASELASICGASRTPPSPLHSAGRRLAPDLPVCDSGLREGSIVGLGRPTAEPAIVRSGLEVAVVGGAHGGAAVALLPGQSVVVGRSTTVELPVPDPEVSRRHARVHLSPDDDLQATIEDLGSTNGVGIGGWRVTHDDLQAGEAVRIGESVVTVRTAPAPERVLEPASVAGRLALNRPPRIRPVEPPVEFDLPVEPTVPTKRRIPLIAALVPLALAPILVLFGFSPIYFLFMLLSPVLLLGNAIADRRNGRADHRRDRATYEADLEALDARLARARAVEERVRREAHPDPTAVVAIACGPTGRLWERRPADADFLDVRLGLGDVDARIRVRTAPRGTRTRRDDEIDPRTAPVVTSVPVVVDLDRAGVLGLAGPRPALLGLTRSVVTALATLHRPADVRLAVLTGADEADDWAWASWLPHLADGRGGRRAAAGRADAEALVAAVVALVEERSAARRDALALGPAKGHRLIVVLDGARRLRAIPGVADILAHGPEVGVHAICLDADEAALPPECGATAVFGPSATRAVVRLPDGGMVDDVLVDGLEPAIADRIARALAPVLDLGGGLADGELPTDVRFCELIGMPDPEAADVAARWRSAPAGGSTRVTIGAGPDGPFEVDLVADGPHALVAGTTGSGKSQLLQTLVASLALANRPEDLNVVLVDYKGGAAFAECADLPHCVGMITDLDGHLAARALASLTAELKRREACFAAVGAADLDQYRLVGHGRPPVPRLVIVVDEFATLVEEVPEFVKGVVGIGMRGRSLGVHVVLATQRPAGVVTADLRANVNLRICLRVSDPIESTDVVDVADAARIPTDRPGRALARLGPSARPVPFQAARVAVRRQGPTLTLGTDASVLVQRRVFGPKAEFLGDFGDDDDADVTETDLGVLVAAVRSAAVTDGWAPGGGPWLPPLPEVYVVRPTAGPGPVVVGLADHPAEQRQASFELDLERLGGLLVVGAARSGRTTFLRTMAAGLAAAHSPERCHLHVLDGGRSLSGLSALPHCGAVVPVDDTVRVDRLLERLVHDIGERQAGAANDSPLVAVLVDKLEAFTALHGDRDGGRPAELLDRIVREGPAVGICVVITTDRSGFTGRLGSALEHRILLRQADRDDWGILGVSPRDVPANLPPGRGLAGADHTEVQLGLLADDPSPVAQQAAVADLTATVLARSGPLAYSRQARRIEALPVSVAVDHLDIELAGAGPAAIVLGVGGDELAPVVVDLADLGGTFVVAGPGRSGRSSALESIVRSLAARGPDGLPIVLVTPRPSPLRDLADLPGVVAVLSGAEELASLGELLDELAPVAVVVDDAELLSDGPVAVELGRLLRTCRDSGSLLVAAGTTDDLLSSRYRGWLADARRPRSGLLLCPATATDGELFDLRLPRATGAGWPPGRGLLLDRGRPSLVQVARP